MALDVFDRVSVSKSATEELVDASGFFSSTGLLGPPRSLSDVSPILSARLSPR